MRIQVVETQQNITFRESDNICNNKRYHLGVCMEIYYYTNYRNIYYTKNIKMCPKILNSGFVFVGFQGVMGKGLHSSLNCTYLISYTG